MPFQKPSHAPIQSHRGGPVGKAIVVYKQAWKKIIGPVLDSVLEFEREQLLRALSTRMDSVLQVLDRRQGALEADLILLTERVRRLEREGGVSDDVRLTNQAILEGREKLADLRAELDGLKSELTTPAKRPSSSKAASKRNGH